MLAHRLAALVASLATGIAAIAALQLVKPALPTVIVAPPLRAIATRAPTRARHRLKLKEY